MSKAVLDAVERVIAALTYDDIERIPAGSFARPMNEQLPLFDRSIAHDLVNAEKVISGRGKTLLGKIGESINEALLAAEEARLALIAEGSGK